MPSSKQKKNKKEKSKFPTPAHEFNIPMYGGTVYIYTNWEDMKKAFKYYHVDKKYASYPTAGQALSLTSNEGSVLHLVGIYDKRMSVLAHELLHVALWTICHVRITINSDNEEILCYLLDELIDRAEPEKLLSLKKAA